MMYRKFIAIVLGIAVAITGLTAAPARAADDDFLKILGGVAAIAIIGSAIAKAKDRDDHVSRGYNYYNHKPRAKHRHRHKHRHGHGHHANRGHHHHKKHKYHRNDHLARPLPNRVQRKLLPASCKVYARNRHGDFLAYSNWCLDRKYRYAGSLPRRCAVNARVLHNNRRNVVYGNNCLRRHGYTSARY